MMMGQFVIKARSLGTLVVEKGLDSVILGLIVLVAGLLGLSALRSHRQTALLVTLSALIGALSVATPWALFPAFGLP